MEFPNGIRKIFPRAKQAISPAAGGEKTSINKTTLILPAGGENKIRLKEQCEEILSKDPAGFRKRDFVMYVNAMISLLGAPSAKEGLTSNPLSYTVKPNISQTITFFKDHKNSNHRITINNDYAEKTLRTRKRSEKSPPLEKGASPFTLEIRNKTASSLFAPTVLITRLITRETAGKFCREYCPFYQNP